MSFSRLNRPRKIYKEPHPSKRNMFNMLFYGLLEIYSVLKRCYQLKVKHHQFNLTYDAIDLCGEGSLSCQCLP